MAQVTRAVAQGIINGSGYTDNEVRQLAHFWLSRNTACGDGCKGCAFCRRSGCETPAEHSHTTASGGAAPVAEGDALPDEDARELAAIGRAVNRAAIELPPGARIQIELERDAGTAYWMDDAKGAWRHIEGSGELFSVQINAAIDAARAQAKEAHHG